MSVRIRPATEANADAIAQTHVDSILTLGPAAYDAAIVNAWGAPRGGEPYLKAMQRGETFFIALDGDLVVGFSSHRIERDRHRTAIYVRGTAARQGIGSRLLRYAVDAARSRDAAEVWVDASLIAVRFYEQNGFTRLESGSHRLQAGLEMACVRMKKTLGVADPSSQTSESVELVPYDTAWPDVYEREAGPIRRALGSYDGFNIQHVGSTAIPGMPAKPIIDIVVGVADVAALPGTLDEIWRDLGYEWGHETDQPGEWLYFIKRDAAGARISQLHVVAAQSAFLERVVHFRDTLRADPREAERYAALKRSLALAYRDERLKYRDAKSDFVNRICESMRSSDD